MSKQVNWRQIYAIKKQRERELLKVNADLPRRSGIYILRRYEHGLKFGYVGQSVNMLERMITHLNGYKAKDPTHIDKSLKAHGLYSSDNETGYKIDFVEYPKELLDEKETEYVLKYGNMGYQLRNGTTGSQGEGKKILYHKDRKGYNQGLINGYENARKDIKQYFKYLTFMQAKDGKLNERMFEKFKEFLQGGNNEG